jgi:nucleoside-diphosphate kinase
MTESFKNVKTEDDGSLFNPKKINVAYTVVTIKPATCCSQEKIQEIISRVEEEGFEIKFMLQRELTKQEAENLYFKHKGEDYFRELVVYNTTGDSVVLLLSHQSKDPISSFKELAGDKDPVKAEEGTLRKKYGVSLVKNEVYCSDDHLGANKDRDIFKFPLPQKIPDFTFDRWKVSLEMLFKFLHPPNIEHSDWNARLDIFATYGPVLNWHSVDFCFCKQCSLLGKKWL